MASKNRNAAPEGGKGKARNVLDRFKKDSGVAPQYGTLAAPGVRPATGKYVQSFDERAVMQEEPPTQDGGPKGSPAIPSLPDAHGPAPKLRVYDGTQNIRADNQILVRETPTSDKGEKNKWASRIGTYRDAAGEGL